ncbi:MAG: hypothetical protein ACP5QS_07775, partial [bacterium]
MRKLFFVLSLFSFSLLFASPPTGALIVDVADVRDSSAISRAIRNALDRESERFRSFARIWETLRRMRFFQNRLPFAFDRIVYLRQNGRIILPSPSRGELTFQFQGWSQDEEQKLSAFVQRAYPIIKGFYGDPAWGGTVTVLKDTSLW